MDLRLGDNLVLLREMDEASVDLAYLDPPFFSERDYSASAGSFKDRWPGGIDVYTDWMRERVQEVHRILKDTGTLYLHCDWHAGHYLKVMMDEVFVGGELQNEVVWYYRGAGVSPRRWGRRHDTILFYTKGKKDWTFNADPVREEYADTTKERFKHYIGNVRKGGDFGQQSLNPEGKHPDDVWEIPIVAPSAKARLGYPTQKPEALLERIILASSNEGDIVLDPFCGCGTTLAVAERLGRQWIGVDCDEDAVRISERRLAAIAPTLLAACP